MRGIGNETTFAGQHAFNPSHLYVHRLNQRQNFCRNAFLFQRRQIPAATTLQTVGQIAQRPKFPGQHRHNHNHQHKQSRRPRNHKFLGHVPDHVGPVFLLLTDRNIKFAVRRLQPDNPPFVVTVDNLPDKASRCRQKAEIFAILVIMKDQTAVSVKNRKADGLVLIVGIMNILNHPVGNFLCPGCQPAPVRPGQLSGQRHLIGVEKLVDLFFGFFPRQNARSQPNDAGNPYKPDDQP